MRLTSQLIRGVAQIYWSRVNICIEYRRGRKLIDWEPMVQELNRVDRVTVVAHIHK